MMHPFLSDLPRNLLSLTTVGLFVAVVMGWLPVLASAFH